jgi:hypothetical protein
MFERFGALCRAVTAVGFQATPSIVAVRVPVDGFPWHPLLFPPSSGEVGDDDPPHPSVPAVKTRSSAAIVFRMRGGYLIDVKIF